MTDYLDARVRGVRELLTRVVRGGKEETIDDSWVEKQQDLVDTYALNLKNIQQQLHDALKTYTKGEPYKVVKTIASGNGFSAWQKLCTQYEEQIEALEVRLMSELYNLSQKPAKSLQETKRMIVELESRAARILQVRGAAPAEETMKMLLSALLDDQTKTFTAQYQGARTSYLK